MRSARRSTRRSTRSPTDRRSAGEPELAHGRPELAREPVLGIDLRGERGDLVGGEALRRLADHVRILAQREIEGHVHDRFS